MFARSVNGTYREVWSATGGARCTLDGIPWCFLRIQVL